MVSDDTESSRETSHTELCVWEQSGFGGEGGGLGWKSNLPSYSLPNYSYFDPAESKKIQVLGGLEMQTD